LIATDTPTLTAELAEVEGQHPGWALHVSEQGTVWAVLAGTTVSRRAATPAQMHHRLASFAHAQRFVGAA